MSVTFVLTDGLIHNRVEQCIVKRSVFPGLESPGKRLLVLESSGNLLTQVKKKMTCIADSKENMH